MSPPSRRKFLFTERSLEFQKSQIGPHLHLSLSPGWLCFARRPPYTAGGLRPPRARGQMDPGKPSSATWPAPWHPPMLTRVPDALSSRHTTPAMRRAAAAPPARRRAPLTQIERPLSLHPSPGSPLAYKNSQSSTVALLLPLLPSSAAPPWPPRSSSRGPASPAPHCPLRPPQ